MFLFIDCILKGTKLFLVFTFLHLVVLYRLPDGSNSKYWLKVGEYLCSAARAVRAARASEKSEWIKPDNLYTQAEKKKVLISFLGRQYIFFCRI